MDPAPLKQRHFTISMKVSMAEAAAAFVVRKA
jgi:hypothetical protein